MCAAPHRSVPSGVHGVFPPPPHHGGEGQLGRRHEEEHEQHPQRRYERPVSFAELLPAALLTVSLLCRLCPEAYVPPQLFYNGKVDYFDLQRLGGLLSHLKKTLKGRYGARVSFILTFPRRLMLKHYHVVCRCLFVLSLWWMWSRHSNNAGNCPVTACWSSCCDH